MNFNKILNEIVDVVLKEEEQNNPFGSPPVPSSTNTTNMEQQPPEDSLENLPPKEEALKVAKDMLSKTRNVPELLKVVKGVVQARYPGFQGAEEVVQALGQETDETLKTVGFQLDRYLKAL